MSHGPRVRVIALSAVLLLVMVPAASAAASRDGLVVWYPFEEGKGDVVKDRSGNGHDARLVDSPKWTKGKNSLAMQFDGRGAHLDCGNDKDLRLTRNFTVAFWVKAGAQRGWYPVAMTWSKSVGKRVEGWSVYVGLPSGPGRQPRFYWYSPLWSLLGDGPGMDIDEWQHVCYTIGPDLQAVSYVNGVPHKRDKAPGPLTSHDGPLIIGGRGGGVEYHFRGAIDDFRLYNRALTASEARDLYEAGEAGLVTPEEFGFRDKVELETMSPEYGVLQWGENRLKIICALPKALQSKKVSLHVVLSRDERDLVKQLVAATGGTATLRLPKLEMGLYTLITRLRLSDGRVLKESRLPVTVCRKLRRGEREAGSLRQGDIWIFDEFEKFTPARGISKTKKKHTWFLETYSFSDGAPEHRYLASHGLVYTLRYTPPLQGRYAVYLGLINPGKGVQAALSAEKSILKTYSPERSVAEGACAIDEKFLQYADLTGKEILALNAPSKMTPNGLAYVKFLRLTRGHMKIVRAKDDISNKRKYVFYNDGELFLFRDNLSARTIEDDVAKYKRGLDRLDMFSVTGGISVMYYATRVGTRLGTLPFESAEGGGGKGAKMACMKQVEVLRRFMAAGNDPLAIAAKAAREHGISLEVNLRMNWQYPDGHPWNSRFRNEHPEFRLLARPSASGQYVLDYYHPEVREERFRLFEEIATRYDVDAICADFTRWPYFFGIAAAGDFEKKFGRKPRFYDPDDWEWFQYRADFMTQLVRRIHKMRLEHQRQTGKRVEFRAILTSRHFLRQGLDVETWVREGIVDALMPGTDYVNYEASDVDIETFVKMTRGTSCKVYVRLDLYMGANPSENQVKKVFWQCLQRGADGVYMYNQAPFRSADLYRNLERWSVFEDVDKCPMIPIRRGGASPVAARP